MVKASIIITTYRRSDVLLRAIGSCLEQTYKNLEIIVIDDNGLDTPYQMQTQSLLEALIKNNKIKYLPLEKNSGACSARNVGVSVAEGEYIFFLDDDDEFLPNRVSRQVEFLDANLDYSGQAVGFIKKREGVQVPVADNLPVIGDFASFLKDGNFYNLMLAIRREDILEVGGFRDIPRYQDIYFMYHLLAHDKRIAVSNDLFFVVHEHSGDRISTRGIDATVEAVQILEDFVKPYEPHFSEGDLRDMKIRRLFMLASTYYSSNYINRLKSTSLWFEIYKLSRNKTYLVYILKSLLPNALIKKLEQVKSVS